MMKSFAVGYAMNKTTARGGIWTHADSRPPELESGALDHSATRADFIDNTLYDIVRYIIY